MANPQIVFKILHATNAVGTNGSGLGFYGATFGTSVPLNQYQQSTFLTSADGSAEGAAGLNLACIPNSTDVIASSCIPQLVNSPVKLINVNGSNSTLTIEFTNDTPVYVQNAQLRIYDRNYSINNPASGVNTKVCEIVNFAGKAYSAWYTDPGNDTTTNCGSGDALWWGAAWPSGFMYGAPDITQRPYYQNSVGVKFYNFTDYDLLVNNSGNRDSRLVGIAGAQATVGGTGIIVPLFDNPGTGGQGLISTGLRPKFTQYINTTSQVSNLGLAAGVNGTGDWLPYTYGGTGASMTHTWRVGISASPYQIGSKTNYAMYVSLEYLS